MEHLSSKLEQGLAWRRDKVREYSIKGYTQRDIAAELKVSLTDVNRDLKYLRQQAKQNIGHYIDEYLPAEYENCLDGLNNIMKEAWQMSLGMKLDLLSSATVIARAVRFVDNHRNNDLIHQNNEVMIYDSAEPIENTG